MTQTRSHGIAGPGAAAWLLAALAVILAACGTATDDVASYTGDTAGTGPSLVIPQLPGGGEAGNAPVPPLDPARVERGRAQYQQLCASCHGAAGEGEDDWMTANTDGTFKAPPHDATGHTWHHSDRLLVGIINGSERFDGAVMPPFGDVLSDEQILDVLEYIKTWWGPDERAVQWQVSLRDPVD